MDIHPTNSTLAAIVRSVDVRTLTADACRGDRVYRHTWRAGDLVIWDNRCVLHRGLPYPADQRRIMCRTTVAGDQSGNEWVLGTTASDE